jgi:hypothetical protein
MKTVSDRLGLGIGVSADDFATPETKAVWELHRRAEKAAELIGTDRGDASEFAIRANEIAETIFDLWAEMIEEEMDGDD